MLSAMIFDLDGVLVDTVPLHAGAWKCAFDQLLESRGEGPPFDTTGEYRRYVDGKPRYEGAAAWLESRGIHLPYGRPADEPGESTVCALGNLKDRYFRQLLDRAGIEPLAGVAELLAELDGHGIARAVVSSSRNAARILAAAGLRFPVRVDGADLDRLPGKPDPAMFLEAARRLGVEPADAAVVEDSAAGVEAGRRGGFGLVVGVGERDHLLAAGAEMVVGATAELSVARLSADAGSPAPAGAAEIGRLLGDRPAVFCDYDGTLTPIVEDPDRALLSASMRRVLARLARSCPVAIISGRDLADVRSKVGMDRLMYAGSHGFEIDGPDGRHFVLPAARSYLPDLDRAQERLERQLADLEGVRVERKRFALAVHTRRALSGQIRERARLVASSCASERLVSSTGKEVVELRPALDWDKGRAVAHVLAALGGDRVPLYLGDDTTDEDAFRYLAEGVGVGVHVGEGPTAARYRLEDPAAVGRFLSALADRWSTGVDGPPPGR